MTTDTDSPKGAERLLWDCSTIGRMLDSEEPIAAGRLAAALGDRSVLDAGLAASMLDEPASASDAA